MSLLNELRAIADIRYRSTKREIFDYYKDQGWSQRQLAEDLSPYTFDKNGNHIKPRNLERDFNPDRLDKAVRTASKKVAYEALGQTLPPIEEYRLPFRIRFRGRVKISGKWEKRREFTVTVAKQGIVFQDYTLDIDGRGPMQFLEDGWEGWLFLAYFKGDDLAEDWEGEFTILP